MSGLPVFLSGDVHLGAVPSETHRAFLSWLEHCGREASKVVLSGDLFDYWFEYKSVVPRGHTRVLGALAALVDGGIPVVLMGGNHDWWGGTFLREEIGIEFYQEPVVLDLAGRRTYIAHGDGFGAGDAGYKVLRFVLRGSLTQFAYRCLHPDIGGWIARRVSKTEGRAGESLEKQRSRSDALREWAVKELLRRPDLDLLVLGHTHFPVLHEAAPDRFYLNAGDWVLHKTYATLTERGKPELWDWGEGAPGRPLSSAMDR